METQKHNKDGADGSIPSAGGEIAWPGLFWVAGATPLAGDGDNAEFEQYLAEQSAATGIPIETLRKMEAEAREKIGQMSPSGERLRSLAERAAPPAKYLEGDESCPF